MLYRTDFKAMGSNIIGMMDCSPSIKDRLLELPDWFEQWEQKFSRFRADSELSRINSNAGLNTLISTEFSELITIAEQAEIISNGIVKTTLLRQLKSAGYDQTFDQISEKTSDLIQPTVFPNTTIFEVELDLEQRILFLPSHLQLDFGGLVKGWAAHQAAAKLGCFAPTLVSAGGDMFITGPMKNGDPWQVSIDDPFNLGETIATLAVYSGAIATSGTYRRQWKLNGITNHHIIDPATGYPAQTDILSSTIISEDPLLAEIAAKTTLILGSKKGAEWAEQQPDLASFFILDDSRVIVNNKMKEFFWSNP